MLQPTLSAGPAALTFLTLAEAKAHFRIDHTDDDALITSLINAVESYLDGYSGILGRALINQTWMQVFSKFCNPMRLKVGIASSVTSITYFDLSMFSRHLQQASINF